MRLHGSTRSITARSCAENTEASSANSDSIASVPLFPNTLVGVHTTTVPFSWARKTGSMSASPSGWASISSSP